MGMKGKVRNSQDCPGAKESSAAARGCTAHAPFSPPLLFPASRPGWTLQRNELCPRTHGLASTRLSARKSPEPRNLGTSSGCEEEHAQPSGARRKTPAHGLYVARLLFQISRNKTLK